MTTAEHIPPLRTVAAFIAWEETQPERYEFVNGVVRMMVGARGRHNIISFNLRTALHARRPAGCRVFAESFKLAVGRDVVYPDVLLTCDPDSLGTTVTSQALLTAEVLSPGSIRDDTFRKKALYLSLPGLKHYLIVSQDAARATTNRVPLPLAKHHRHGRACPGHPRRDAATMLERRYQPRRVDCPGHARA